MRRSGQIPQAVNKSEDEDDESSEELEFTTKEYHDPLKGGQKSTNLIVADSKYVGDWKARHGFRELYQNWRDAIKESNQLGSRKFITKPQHDNNVLLFIAIHPDKVNEIGYIKFSKKKGIVELTNYNAWLSGKTLGIGSTSKIGKDHLAGYHGEGYKVAALALFRERYTVRIKASECDWKFLEAAEGTQCAGELCVRIRRENAKKILKLKEAHALNISEGLPRLRKGNVWEDVTFEIGGRKGRLVDEAEFMEWIKFALELDPPSKVLETRKGSLILDPKFDNKIFLQGILLEESSFSSSKFKFGYDLAQGRANRDRTRLSSTEMQRRLIAEIWAEAIKKDPTLSTTYTDMLQSHQAPADVDGAERLISNETARKIWSNLSSKDSGRKVFFYDSRAGEKDVELITQCLKMKPVQLMPGIWIPLKKFGLVRTPREQQIRVFRDSPEVADNGTIYSIGLKQALKAALYLDVRTKGLDVVFKAVDKAQLTLLLSGSRLEINAECLDFRASHEKSPCFLSRQPNIEETVKDQFSCDHIVTDLYKLVLEELKRVPQLISGQSSDLDSSLYLRVCESLRQMPMMVAARPGRQAGEIEVSWTDLEGDLISRIYRLDPKCRITLHRESTCSHKRHDVLAPTSADEDGSPSETSLTAENGQATVSKCRCPEKVVSQKNFQAVFTELNHEEEYFPMVSRSEPEAFFGVPPPPVRPTAPVIPPPIVPSRSPPKNVRSTHEHPAEDALNDEDIYDASPNGSDKFTGVYMPHSRPVSQDLVAESGKGLHERGDNIQSRSVSLANPPQAQRQPVTILHRNNHQLQLDEDNEDISGELDSVNATLESLRNELSRLKSENRALIAQVEGIVQNRHNVDAQLQAARAEGEIKEEKLLVKEQELQAAQAKIQQQRETLDRLDATHLNKGVEVEELKRANQRLEDMSQDVNVQINALHIQIQHLKKENAELNEDSQLAKVVCDKLIMLATETAERRERVLRRGKRARGNVEEDGLLLSERQRLGITAREEGATQLTSEDGIAGGGGDELSSIA